MQELTLLAVHRMGASRVALQTGKLLPLVVIDVSPLRGVSSECGSHRR
jgi:hypothetical protein